jgi:hypothetical protein
MGKLASLVRWIGDGSKRVNVLAGASSPELDALGGNGFQRQGAGAVAMERPTRGALWRQRLDRTHSPSVQSGVDDATAGPSKKATGADPHQLTYQRYRTPFLLPDLVFLATSERRL